MKCTDVLRVLNDDSPDLRAVRRHLESCPECSKRFARDLKLEEALRDLHLEIAPVDVTAEVMDSVRFMNKHQTRQEFIRRWIWLAVSVTTLALLVIAVPILAGWSQKLCDLVNRFDPGRWVDSAFSPVMSPRVVAYSFLFMAAALAWMVAHFWRESRSTIQ